MTKRSLRFSGSRRSSERISFIVIILNREVQVACREKNHSLFQKVYIIEQNSSDKKYAMRERGERIGEKPQHVRQKHIQLCMILQGKDGILSPISTLRKKSFH